MKTKDPTTEMAPLEPLVGEWSVEALFPGAPPSDLRGRTVFEWMTGGTFVLQRWEVPIDEAPDGLAVIGPDPENSGGYLQHYEDGRTIRASWEICQDGSSWEHDFDLVYARVG